MRGHPQAMAKKLMLDRTNSSPDIQEGGPFDAGDPKGLEQLLSGP